MPPSNVCMGRRAPADPRATAKVAVLRTLRRICVHLRGLQNSAATTEAYAEVESLLAREERAARRASVAGTAPVLR
jgi:hypothetical protein